jgi:hypothetical protein
MDIINYLKQEKVFDDVNGYNEVKTGASGARIYEVEASNGHFIVKYVQKDECKIEDAWSLYEREWKFYSVFKDLKISFLPKVNYIKKEEDKNIVMVFDSYERIPHRQWSQPLQLKAVDLCARLNSIDIAFGEKIGIQYKKTETDKESLDNSYQEWQYVLNKYGSRFGGNVLKHIYENFIRICDVVNTPPYNICHGDFHPDNILLNYNGGKASLVICDWQNINISKGIGDIAFFISRSKDFDIEIDEDVLITHYCERLSFYTGKTVEKSEIYRVKNASTVITSFLYWAFYLTNADEKRVSDIYDEMAKAFLSLNLC